MQSAPSVEGNRAVNEAINPRRVGRNILLVLGEDAELVLRYCECRYAIHVQDIVPVDLPTCRCLKLAFRGCWDYMYVPGLLD